MDNGKREVEEARRAIMRVVLSGWCFIDETKKSAIDTATFCIIRNILISSVGGCTSYGMPLEP